MEKDLALDGMLESTHAVAAQGVQDQAEAAGSADSVADPEPETGETPPATPTEGEESVSPVVVEEPAEDGEEAPQKHELVFPLSYPVVLAELRERIPFLLDHGLNVEVDLSDTTYNGEVTIRELERLAIELRRNKIKVIAHLPHRDLKIASRDKMIRQHSMDAIQEGLEIGKILGARIAVFHSGYSNHVKPQEKDWWIEECISALEEVVSRAQEEEVIVALKKTWESDEQVILRLFESVDSPWFRFCCDLGHAACFSQFAPEEWIVQFHDRISNLTFHDNDGMEDQHLACGAGVVGYDVVSETIHEELTEPVNITIEVAETDLLPSIQHLEECGFRFERSVKQ